uniref:NADH-ubiquinone oxidoreductase chain 6 n=1 Tax=Galegeeska revoilii TaxID=483428 RepID=A0A7G5BD85_9EUTH|nr:NADH dehydrogenase subunit 6 [Galegeeska revoilii]QMV34620.1 NADH dehydrogenase subunit 6 [Galegeeska revoilii]QMV34646.1 NADH dehydrogenase subunit 6 [Galegeeska revoilii]
MMYNVLLSVVFVLGMVGVSSKPSPIFGGLGLIISGGVGCAMVVGMGGSFLGLMMFLVYLGGMMVVFGYTTAMATEEYPEAWGSSKVIVGGVVLGVLAEILVLGWLFLGMNDGVYDVVMNGFDNNLVELGVGSGLVRGDYVGSSLLYGSGSWLLLISGWVLFVSIFIIIEIVRGV